MININELSMSYGEKLLFYDVNLNLNTNTRYALVGANGCGKSTFLKLLNGEEEALSGTVSISKSTTIGWLKQDQFRYEDTRITDVVIQGKPALWQALTEKEELLAGSDWNDAIGNRLGELEEIIAHHNGYEAEAFAEKLLIGLGVPQNYHHQPLKALSGGFKLRVLLAQALFQEPDLLLLDEPTNHLDIISVAWLEKYLKNEYSGLLLFISHDVSFINRLADYILDVDYGEIRQYSGNYQKFLEEKKLIEEQKLHILKNLEERIASMQSFVDKFRSKASKARQAQSRLKMIEKIELPDIKQSSRVAPNFQFTPLRPSGKRVLKVKNLSKHFQDKEIFNKVNFEVHRGERIAILGTNGVGKSTLIKALLGKITHDDGEYEWGHESHISYFSQDHHDSLNKHISALEWLTEQTNKPEQRVRQALGQMLFPKDDVHKDILALSGGEAARLLLAKIMLEANNILVLDEPTNHLDLEAIEALASALRNFTGTVIFVSHDRHFVDKIADRILFLSKDKKLRDFHGSYFDFQKTLM